MAAVSFRRRLAAIVVLDVAGYSRLLEVDETAALKGLIDLREGVVCPSVARNSGRIIKLTGDGCLIEFASALNAVTAALEMQQTISRTNRKIPQDKRFLLRIGINLGDVVDDADDVLGEGVNIAARLEALATPGGICISSNVHEEITGRIEERFHDAGKLRLKNIARAVRAWHWPDALQSALTLPERPSIAVLPFANMGEAHENDLFVDGLTDDLITDLSRSAGLFVIARNSVFVYKGKPVDVKTVARELGVRYILEGSARRSAGRIRINVLLNDTMAGQQIWAERFDRTAEDVFAVQDEVNSKIVQALIGRLTASFPRKRPQNLEAHDLCLRARVLSEESPQTAREAFLLLKRAIELEPTYAEAHGLLAYNRWLAWTHFGEPEEPNRKVAVDLAERAVALDENDAGCRYFLGTILAYERRWEESNAAFAAALELDPNHADTWAAMSDVSVLDGRVQESLEQIQKALRLNPYPAVWYHCHLGQAQYAAGDYASAVETLRNNETYRTNSRKFLAASLAQLGRLEEAVREGEMFLVAHPHFTIDHWINSQPLRDMAVRDHFVEGFLKARLPKGNEPARDLSASRPQHNTDTRDIEAHPSLSVKVLGNFRVEFEGKRLPLPPSKKTRALFAYLAVVNKSVQRERLCEIFWEVPDDPRSALRWSLTKIRSFLGEYGHVLQTDRNTVQLCLSSALDYSAVMSLAKENLLELPTDQLVRTAGLIDGHFLEDLSLERCRDYEAWRRAMTDEVDLLELRLLRELVDRFQSEPEAALRYSRRLRLLSQDASLDAEIERLSAAARRSNLGNVEVVSDLDPAPSAKLSEPSIQTEHAQDVRFCKARDGTRLAYASSGKGSPVLRAAHWMSHLTYDWHSPIWHHWITTISQNHRLIRYDERCNGLSQREVADVSFEAMVSDLEAVVEAAGLKRFTLFGISQGCALSVAYAARHPERVSGLILYGGYVKGWRARGNPSEIATRQALATLMREGWGTSNPLFRQLFSSMFIRGAGPEHFAWMDDLQRRTILPDDAWRLQNAFADIDVSALLPKVTVPTIVLHARDDAVAPVDSGKALASEIKGARFFELDSQNHILLKDEPAFAEFINHLNAFIASTSDERAAEIRLRPSQVHQVRR